jgi:hypothetical protein
MKSTLYGKVNAGHVNTSKPRVHFSKNGKPTTVPNAYDYMLQFLRDGKQRQQSCGASDVHAAYCMKLQKEQELSSGAPAPASQAAPGTFPHNTKRILSAEVKAWREEIRANKKHKTYLAYANSTKFFLMSCKKDFVEDIVRADLLVFKTFLRDEKLGKRSAYNNFPEHDNLHESL